MAYIVDWSATCPYNIGDYKNIEVTMLSFTCALYHIEIRLRPEEIAYYQSNYKDERTIGLKCGRVFTVLDTIQLIANKMRSYRINLEEENAALCNRLTCVTSAQRLLDCMIEDVIKSGGLDGQLESLHAIRRELTL